LDVAEEALLETSDKARAHLVRARQLAYESLIEARWSVQALRPRALVDHDLPTALTRLVEQVTAQTPVQARVQIHGTPCLLSPTVENALLRISQEALTNTVKHAQARTAHLALTFDTAEVSLRVSDDGHGFDPYQAAPQHGFGLISMRERAEHIGGHLTLTSQPSHGTAIRVVVPMVQGHRQGGLDEYRQSDSYSDCRRSPCGA
jgi:signal transduction histidine kinase